MTYSAVYCALISKRLWHPLPDGEYGEVHHIIPKSEGGSNEKDNLVKLSAREHYIAHLLLAKIYKDFKMYSAITYFHSGNIRNRKFNFNSHLYQKVREECSKRLSVVMKGRNSGSSNGMFGKSSWDCLTPEQIASRKEKARQSMLGRRLSEEAKRKISKANKGKSHPQSEETKNKIGLKSKGRKHSADVKQQLSVFASKRNIGRTWWTDGIVNCFSFDCPNGFHKGRVGKWKNQYMK